MGAFKRACSHKYMQSLWVPGVIEVKEGTTGKWIFFFLSVFLFHSLACFTLSLSLYFSLSVTFFFSVTPFLSLSLHDLSLSPINSICQCPSCSSSCHSFYRILIWCPLVLMSRSYRAKAGWSFHTTSRDEETRWFSHLQHNSWCYKWWQQPVIQFGTCIEKKKFKETLIKPTLC